MPTKTPPINWRPCHSCFPPGNDLHDAASLETCITCKRQYCHLHFRSHSCKEAKQPSVETFICSVCEEPFEALLECSYCGEEDLCQDCLAPHVHNCANWDGALSIEEKELRDADHAYEENQEDIRVANNREN